MIAPADGVAFTTAADGDMRRNHQARQRLGLAEWATVRQVHGSAVVDASASGDHGEADGLATSATGLALAVFTADCLGVVMHGAGRVAVVHAGWRGVAAGVVANAVERVGDVASVHIGPHIRPCCFEVGPEVSARFVGHLSRTRTGTTSVDLASAVAAQLPVEPEIIDRCTRCGNDMFSHRRNGTGERLATVGWVPS
ncbi:MAG: polyphenol oxidase family protein [Acidimicrobiia bacterium]